MNKLLEDFKQLKNYSACCRCQYHIDKKCTNKGECIWKTIEQALKDYQEIKEIAKHYNWDDITGEIFKVETDKKYRDLFNSAIVNIQEDYRKARALENIENKGVFVHLLQQSKSVEEYNSLMLIAFKKMAERDYKGAVEKFCLTAEEYDSLKEAML